MGHFFRFNQHEYNEWRVTVKANETDDEAPREGGTGDESFRQHRRAPTFTGHAPVQAPVSKPTKSPTLAPHSSPVGEPTSVHPVPAPPVSPSPAPPATCTSPTVENYRRRLREVGVVPILATEGGLARGSDATGLAPAVQPVPAPPVSQSPASVAAAPPASRSVMVESTRAALAPRGAPGTTQLTPEL